MGASIAREFGFAANAEDREVPRMPLSPTPEDAVEITASLKRYFLEEFDQPLSDLKARLLLDYVLKEIGPVAYNAGVRDAEAFLRRTVEDLPATCFEAPLTYWRQKRK